MCRVWCAGHVQLLVPDREPSPAQQKNGSDTHPLTHALTHSRTHAHSNMYPLTHSHSHPTYPLTHSLNQSPNQSINRSLHHSLTRPPDQSVAHPPVSHTYSNNSACEPTQRSIHTHTHTHTHTSCRSGAARMVRGTSRNFFLSTR